MLQVYFSRVLCFYNIRVFFLLVNFKISNLKYLLYILVIWPDDD
jgi:hypothetical protein